VGRWQRAFDRQAMSAVEGIDDEQARDKRDAEGDGLAGGPTGSVGMPANCVVCVTF